MSKVAVVTGGTRGIGFGIVSKLYSEGFRVVALSRNSTEQIEELNKESSGKVGFKSLDISNLDNIRSVVKEIKDEYGRIDVLVNNAGVAPKERNSILEMTAESFDFVMDINLKGTFFMTQTVANIMIDQETTDFPSKIVNVSSMSAYTSSTNRGEYCISKAGVSMVTTLFADKLADYGIMVYEVRPGIIQTDMTSTVEEKYETLIKEEGILPVRRWGRPEDIANVVNLLCSPEMTYSTGDVINVDGGFHIRRL